MNNETTVNAKYRQNDWGTFALRTVHIRLGCVVVTGRAAGVRYAG